MNSEEPDSVREGEVLLELSFGEGGAGVSSRENSVDKASEVVLGVLEEGQCG